MFLMLRCRFMLWSKLNDNITQLKRFLLCGLFSFFKKTVETFQKVFRFCSCCFIITFLDEVCQKRTIPGITLTIKYFRNFPDMPLAVIHIVRIIVRVMIEAERIECFRQFLDGRKLFFRSLSFLCKKCLQVLSGFHTEERIQESRVTHGDFMIPDFINDEFRSFERDRVSYLIIFDDIACEVLHFFRSIRECSLSVGAFHFIRNDIFRDGFLLSFPLALRKDFLRFGHTISRLWIRHTADDSILFFQCLPLLPVAVIQINTCVNQTLDTLFRVTPCVAHLIIRTEGMNQNTPAVIIHKTALTVHELVTVSAKTVFLAEKL